MDFLFALPAWVSPELAVMVVAAGLAGFVDAVAGGGGLVQLPALLAVYPQHAPATLFGTNKLASICGTTAAVRQYLQRVQLPWATVLPAFATTLVGAFAGAACVSLLPREAMRPLALVLLLAVAVYVLRRRDLGGAHAPRHAPERERLLACAAGGVIGWYDGFFGPGTGSFFVFVLVRGLGWDFLHASAGAKLLNWASNAAALAWFMPTGHVLWPVALAMAAANVAGARLGSREAMRRGAGFVRRILLGVLAAAIAKTAWDIWRAG